MAQNDSYLLQTNAITSEECHNNALSTSVNMKMTYYESDCLHNLLAILRGHNITTVNKTNAVQAHGYLRNQGVGYVVVLCSFVFYAQIRYCLQLMYVYFFV